MTMTSDRLLTRSATSLQGPAELRHAERPRLGQSREDVCQVAAFGLGGQDGADLLVEDEQPYRVLLADHHVSQSRREADRVVHLRHAAAVGVVHAAGAVHHEVAFEIRLGLELLDVVAVGLAVDAPVDQAGIVAGRVLAVLAELHRKPVKRRAVQPAQESLHDKPGLQVQTLNLLDDFRPEIFLGRKRHDAHCRRAPGCMSIPASLRPDRTVA